MPEMNDQWHAAVTIQYGELLEGGFIDWDRPEWRWDAYDDEQYRRVCKKINDHYYYREIGCLPPDRWRHELIRKMNEIMPKYKLLYKMLTDSASPFQVLDEYRKTRNINSDFPVTQLRPDVQDYASGAQDVEEEHVVEGDFLDKYQKLQAAYTDVDLMIVNELDSMFTFFNSVALPY